MSRGCGAQRASTVHQRFDVNSLHWLLTKYFAVGAYATMARSRGSPNVLEQDNLCSRSFLVSSGLEEGATGASGWVSCESAAVRCDDKRSRESQRSITVIGGAKWG
jgi:hypothetical protein